MERKEMYQGKSKEIKNVWILFITFTTTKKAKNKKRISERRVFFYFYFN